MKRPPRYYEQLILAITPKAMEALAPVIRERAENEFDDVGLATELANLANDFDSRLQHIAAGDLQG